MAARTGDLHALAMLKMATGARPGLVQHTDEWKAAADEATRLADESGDRHLRVAIRASSAYARLCAGEFDEFERWLDEALELAGGDPAVGAGIVIGNPAAWALMGKGTVRREQGEMDEAERLLDAALKQSTESGDPETESWIRGTQALLRSARGDHEGGLALARRNCERTEQIGDVFSRSLAIANLSVAQRHAGESAAALESIEEADRLYRDAMGNGGEMEPWRDAMRAEALIEVGRPQEAEGVAAGAAEIAQGARPALAAAAGAAGAGQGARGHRRRRRRPRGPRRSGRGGARHRRDAQPRVDRRRARRPPRGRLRGRDGRGDVRHRGLGVHRRAPDRAPRRRRRGRVRALARSDRRRGPRRGARRRAGPRRARRPRLAGSRRRRLRHRLPPGGPPRRVGALGGLRARQRRRHTQRRSPPAPRRACAASSTAAPRRR